MRYFIVYDPDNGLIHYKGKAPQTQPPLPLIHLQSIDISGTDYAEINTWLYRVDVAQIPHVAVLKTGLPVSNKTTATNIPVTFFGIPSGTTVFVEGESASIDDGTFTFQIDFPGVYPLKFTNPIYLDTTITVTVT